MCDWHVWLRRSLFSPGIFFLFDERSFPLRYYPSASKFQDSHRDIGPPSSPLVSQRSRWRRGTQHGNTPGAPDSHGRSFHGPVAKRDGYNVRSSHYPSDLSFRCTHRVSPGSPKRIVSQPSSWRQGAQPHGSPWYPAPCFFAWLGSQHHAWVFGWSYFRFV